MTSRLSRNDRGAAMVEMVFAVPLFIIIVVGIVELGRMIVLYHALADGSRAAARYLARIETRADPSDEQNYGVCSGLQKERAASLVATRTLDWSADPLFTGWPTTAADADNSNVFDVEIGGCTGNTFAGTTITVTASARFDEATGLMGLIGLTSGFMMSGGHQQVRIPD